MTGAALESASSGVWWWEEKPHANCHNCVGVLTPFFLNFLHTLNYMPINNWILEYSFDINYWIWIDVSCSTNHLIITLYSSLLNWKPLIIGNHIGFPFTITAFNFNDVIL